VLAGIRVVDVTRFLPGGYCTLLLADLGAEVIKVEEPGRGDPARTPHPTLDAIGARHLLRNRGKKSVALDLRDPGARAAMVRLVQGADVLVEGFRPGVASRLGIGWAEMHAVNRRLVYCSISGYGQDGPYRDLPGHDVNYAAWAGALGVLAAGRPPEPPALQVADIAGGMLAATAVLAALLEARETGQGRHVDVSLADAAASMLYLPYAGHVARRASGAASPGAVEASRSGYAVYRTADGKYLALGISHELPFWQRLCQAVGRDDLATEAHLWGARQEEARAVLEKVFGSRPRDEWFERLRGADLPCVPVHDFDEVTGDPHARARGTFFPGPSGFMLIGCPIKTSPRREPPAVAPGLGEHTDEVLAALGYSPADVAALRARGAA
jgi:crotonobetainyl-CoA:carnitine CoA-transferase CaiB-like acyl-CoA transferase